MDFPHEIINWLEAPGGVGTFGTTLFIGSKTVLPATGTILVLIETGGSGPTTTHGGASVERPSGQLSARAVKYADARNLLENAYDALGGANGLHNVTLSGTRYLSIKTRNGFTDAGLDGAGRIMLTLNLDGERAVTGTPQLPSNFTYVSGVFTKDDGQQVTITKGVITSVFTPPN